MIILIGLLISFQTRSQERLNLDSIIVIITNNNPGLKMYDAEIRSLDEAAKGARNWEAPQISTGLWMVPYNPNLWKKMDGGNPGMGQYMISGEQMFPNKKKFDAEQKYLQGISSVEAARKLFSLNDLIARARQNYFEWFILVKKLKIIGENEKLLDFMIKSAELRYKNGLGKINVYYKVKAALGNNQRTRIMLQNDLSQRSIALNTLMNRNKDIVFEIDTNYNISSYINLLIDGDAIERRSDITAIQQNLNLVVLQQALEKTKLKPEFGIRYDHMFGFGGFPMQYSLMGMVKLPMAKWSSRSARANVESLRWKAESLNAQRETIINEATGSAQAILKDIQSNQEQIELFQNNIIPALKNNFRTIQLAYEQNTEDLFQLYDAWETLNRTELEYLNQLQSLLMKQVELQRILEVK